MRVSAGDGSEGKGCDEFRLGRGRGQEEWVANVRTHTQNTDTLIRKMLQERVVSR